jgi:hypothetical protein
LFWSWRRKKIHYISTRRGDNRFGKCGVQQSVFSISRPPRVAAVVYFDGACLQSDPGSQFDVGGAAGAGLGGLWWRNDCLKGLLSLQAEGAAPIMKKNKNMRPSLINTSGIHAAPQSHYIFRFAWCGRMGAHGARAHLHASARPPSTMCTRVSNTPPEGPGIQLSAACLATRIHLVCTELWPI